jgi:hypothetical protein
MKAKAVLRRATQIGSALALGCGSCAAPAQSVSESTAESMFTSRAVAAAPAAAASAPAVWNRRSWSLPINVIELPSERPFGPPTRKHHALTWRNDALSHTLNNAGWAGAECHQRVRLPSRWRQSSAQTGSGGPEVQLQIALGCSF